MKVNLLGPLEVEDDAGDGVAVSGPKQRALVALLASNVGHAVSADRLAEALWGEGVDRVADADNALQHHVSRLRKLLGPDRLGSDGNGYVLLLDGEDVDAVRFERLVAEARAELRAGRADTAATLFGGAAALWRGAPFQELDGDWARFEATRLEQLRLEALEDGFDADLTLGRHRDVVNEVEAVLRDEPFRERLWGQLVTALYRCGRQTDAIAALQRARHALLEAHGLEPGPELRALEDAVLRHDPALTWTPPPTTERPAAPAEPPPARPRRDNLPAPLTRFVGREDEVQELRRIVAECRLVTLTGTGGAGKTRLAIEVAKHCQVDFPDGAWLVELAPLASPAEVPHALVAALAADRVAEIESLPSSLPSWLQDHLRARRLLLVVDNCEHLLDGVSGQLDALLAQAPDLHVLATSREPLGIPGEMQWAVPPLSMPGALVGGRRDLVGSDAVRLFEDRARLVGAFELTDETASAVGQLCRRLDGLPLAIELAAARTKTMPIAHIAAQLRDRFELLVSTSRVAPPRQRTLRATFDWSFAALSDDERTLFLALSVCEGGCSLDAALRLAAEAGIDGPVTELLAGLVDKSLIVAQPASAPEPRFDILETLRAYGHDRLRDSATLDGVRRAHRELFRDLVAHAERGLLTREYRAWHARLDLELTNIRAAYDSAIEAGDWEAALQLGGDLWWFWATSNRHADGEAWMEAALIAAGDDLTVRSRARALTCLCFLAAQVGDVERAVAWGGQAVALSGEAGDELEAAWAAQSLALTFLIARQRERALPLLADARRVMDAAGEHWRVAANELIGAIDVLGTGDPDAVDAHSDEVLRRSEPIGYDPFCCWGHLMKAWVAEQRHDLARADAECEQAVTYARRVGLGHFYAFALTHLGRVATLTGALVRAEEHLSEAVGTADACGATWFADLARVRLAQVRGLRGDADAARALAGEVLDRGGHGRAPHVRGFIFQMIGGDPLTLARAQLT